MMTSNQPQHNFRPEKLGSVRRQQALSELDLAIIERTSPAQQIQRPLNPILAEHGHVKRVLQTERQKEFVISKRGPDRFRAIDSQDEAVPKRVPAPVADRSGRGARAW